MKAWTEGTYAIEVYRAKSGWIIRRRSANSQMMGEDVAGLSDDEGLVEWFSEQLGFGYNIPERPAQSDKGAGSLDMDLLDGPRADIGKLAAEHTTALLQVSDIRRAMQRFVELAKALREDDDVHLIDCKDGGEDNWVEVRLGQLRQLMKAAGLWTDEMLPLPVAATKPAEAGEDSPPPVPATVEDPAERAAAQDYESGRGFSDEPERDDEGRTAQDRYDDEHGDPLPGLPEP